ncbi:AAA family ATPase [Nonomuraea insulae]|uniref:AAA family ATPase n=1 Tax=Nonomuraea insulae TaxID=1616787 RepID=A0ABW1CH56_9ACTN
MSPAIDSRRLLGTDHNLGKRLHAARERSFVGRKEELAAFARALDSGGRVFYVHGPGGVGKSALLRRFVQEATAAGRPVTLLDGRTLDPSPAAFEAEAGQVLGDERGVLLVDTFERIQGLECWVRERFLPRVPVGTVIVMAGRNPPHMMWQADPGWAGTLQVMPLRDLEPAEAADLLDARGVADELRAPLLAFAGGHPLALSLGAAVAIRDSEASSRWTPTQDVVSTLLGQLVGEVPSPAHWHALEVCAHTYMTTEDLVRAVLPDHDAAALFAWLRRLPFVESSPLGLYPHDVVREILEADLRWRDPQGYADMHQRIMAHLVTQIRLAADADVLGAVGSLFYIHRGPGATSRLHDWSQKGETYEDVFRPEDTEDLVRLAVRAEGEEQAETIRFWTARQPRSFHLYRRTDTGELVGCCAWLRLDELDEETAESDPIMATAWATARATAPLRPGEHLAVIRVWGAGQNEKCPTPDLVQWRAIGYCLRSERMAWSFAAMGTERAWAEHYKVYQMHDLGEHAWVGGSEYALYAHDWRAAPACPWLERLLAAGGQDVPAARQEPELAVLSQEEFTGAVRKALRHLSRHTELAANPLTRTRLLAGRADPARALRDLLEQGIKDLSRDPRAGKLHRALDTTYLRGVPTQEAAAERLGLPFTTYRRHLLAGIERVSEDLWRRELWNDLEPISR